MDKGRAALNITAPENHVLDIWMREDGFAVPAAKTVPDPSPKKIVEPVIFFLCAVLMFACTRTPPPENYPGIVQSIIETFESRSSELNHYRLGHFYERLYRISGEPRYRVPLRKYSVTLAQTFRIQAENLQNAEFVRAREDRLLTPSPNASEKILRRIAHRKKWRGMLFANRLLFRAFQVKSYGLDKSALHENYETAMAWFRSLPFEDYLFDPGNILSDASHTVNAVFYLKFLGIADYEDPFTRAFKQAFPDAADASLDKTAYLNKIYGLTHFIIADSQFYQRKPDAAKHAWVLEYFAGHYDTIEARTNPDLLAELAICFKLAGQKNHPVVRRVQKYLAAAFDPKRGLIPSTLPDKSLNGLEHRNIVAVIALSGFDELFPGPLNEKLAARPAGAHRS
ncbi:MAG: hypothetical protein A2Z83_00380 [Omnitrophica bacterium GWA2_52_8]|nr:MAG: hypothetical protein A2Z83_00380 [Omnitrophica bacterium GWA2_52_8]